MIRRALPSDTRRGTFARKALRLLRGIATEVGDLRTALLGVPRSTRSSLRSIPAIRARDQLQSGAASLPRVTIVIPVHGKWDLTERCLRALERTEARMRATIVVVDDLSPDRTLDEVRAFGWVQVRKLSTNVGFPGACNAGAAGLETDYVLFLNNDTEPIPGFVDALVRTADQDRTTVIVGSRLIYPDGRLQEAGGIIWKDGTGENYGRGRSPDDPRYIYVRDVDYCSAASILVRTSFFQSVGGFDESYSRGYYEDTDLAFAARKRHFRVVYQPQSVVVHLEGGSHGTDVSSGVKRFQVVNRHLFANKWVDDLVNQLEPGVAPSRIAASLPHQQAVLLIDHAVPTPDRDSGSRRTWELIGILRSLGYDVVFGAEHGDPWGSDADALRQLGVMVLSRRRQIMEFLTDEGLWLACVFISRAPVAAVWQPRIARRFPGVPVVFDTVDIHHLRELGEAKLAGSGAALRAAAETERAELSLARASNATIVVSETEAGYLRKRVPGSVVLTVSNIHHVSGERRGFRARTGLLFVGGFRHSPNADAIAWFLTTVWPLLSESVRADGLEIIGQDPPHRLVASAPPQVRFLGWVPDLDRALLRARVAIAPLRFGAGVKGKVGEAWSYGLPVVGTSVAMDGMAEPGSAAYLVGDSPAQFAARIGEVYDNESTWQVASEAGRLIVAERFSPEHAATALSDVLRRVARQPPMRLGR